MDRTAAEQLALEQGMPAIQDVGPTTVNPPDDSDPFDESGLMSEIGDNEKQARQAQLDAASSEFLTAVDTGMTDADGLHWYDDGTWRPGGIYFGPPPVVHDLSTPPAELATDELTPKRRRAVSPSAMDKDTELLPATVELPSSGSEAWIPVDTAILAPPVIASPWDGMVSSL